MSESCWSEGSQSWKRVKAPPNAGSSGTREGSAPAWPTPASVVAHAHGAHDALFPVYSATWDLIEEVLKQKRTLEPTDTAALGSITTSTERVLEALACCRQLVELLAEQMLPHGGKRPAEGEEQKIGRSEEVLEAEEPKAPVRKGEQQLTDLACVVVMASRAADAAESFKELLGRFMQSISHTGGRSEADVAAVGRLYRQTQRWREIVDESHYPLEVLQCELESLNRVEVEPSTHAAPVPSPSTQQISPPPAPVPTAALVVSPSEPVSVLPQTLPRQDAEPTLAGYAPSTRLTSPPSPGQPTARAPTTTPSSPSLPPPATPAKTWASVAKSSADGKQKSAREQGMQHQQPKTVRNDIRGSGSGVVHAKETQGAVGVTQNAQPEPRATSSTSAARTDAQTDEISTTCRKDAFTKEAVAAEAAMPAAVVKMIKAARPTASWTEQRNQGFQASKALHLQYDAFVSQQNQPQRQVSVPPEDRSCGGRDKGKQPAIPESGRPEVPPTAGTPSASFADKMSATSGSVLKCSSGTTGEGAKTDECHKSKASLTLSVPTASTPSSPTSSSTSPPPSPSSASASPSALSPPSSSPSSPTSERAPAPFEHAFIHHVLDLNRSDSHLTSPGRGSSEGTGDSEAGSGCGMGRMSKKGRQRQRRKAAKEASEEQKKSELEELEAVVRAQPSFSSYNHKAHDWRSDRRRRRFLGRLLRKGQAVYLRSNHSA